MSNQEQFSPEFIEMLEKMAKQRAGLMAIIHSIINPEMEFKDVDHVKTVIITTLTSMIDKDMMVGDYIDNKVIEQVLNYAETRIAVEDAQDLIDSKD